ncbi:hypothetical protein Tcan_00941, partial [Toxocara canis]
MFRGFPPFFNVTTGVCAILVLKNGMNATLLCAADLRFGVDVVLTAIQCNGVQLVKVILYHDNTDDFDDFQKSTRRFQNLLNEFYSVRYSRFFFCHRKRVFRF